MSLLSNELLSAVTIVDDSINHGTFSPSDSSTILVYSQQIAAKFSWVLLSSIPGNLFAFTLLSRIKAKLLESRRVEQSGFTPGRSMVDRILTLNTLIQTR